MAKGKKRGKGRLSLKIVRNVQEVVDNKGAEMTKVKPPDPYDFD